MSLPARRARPSRPAQDQDPIPATRQIPSTAYIQAYESRLIHGRGEYAKSLTERSGGEGSRGGGLIRWVGEVGEGEGEEEEIWLDR